MDSPFSKLTTRVSLAMVVVVVLSMTAMVRHWGFVVMPTLKAEEKTKVELLVVPYARLLEAAVSEENQQNLDDVLDQVISLKGSGHEFPIVVRLKVSLLDGRVFERKNDVDDVAKPFRAEVPIFSPVTRTLLGSVVLEYNDVFYRHLIAKVWEEVAWTLAIILLLLIAMQFWVRSLLSPLTDLSGRLEHVDLDAEITLPLASRSMSAEVRQVWGAIEQLFARLRQRDEAVASGHIAAQEALQSKLEAETENKEKSQFLANMSHELRTPLNAIIGYSEMLYDEAGESGNANMAGDLVRIVSSGRHLLSLINGVLDLAKIDAGRTQLFLSDYSLTEIVKEVVDAVSPLISANGNQLTIQCDDNVGNVYADISKLKQALINVLGNAAKFTHDGNVLLAVEREFSAGQERVLFRIVDTGIGISEEQQHALFKPFTQVDESTTREYGGTGLGLTISRSVCRLMGGEIKVRSEEGKGSEFVLQIPIKVLEPYGVGDATAAYEVNAPQEDPEKKRLLDKRPNQNSRERREKVSTILVIDNDPSAGHLLERSLGGYGFRVEMVCGGSEGVGRAAELKPDLILLDVLVSDGSDWSVLSQLKSNPVLRHVPVVLHSMIDERSVAMALGAIDYILKPADRAILGECIKRNLRAPRGPVALIIDEDVERRRLLGVFIEDQGWMAVEAANADLGLIRLAESLPTVIVLDLDAPKASDIEFLRQLGSTSEWKAIPVLALSDLIIDGAMREKLLESVDSLTEKGEAGLDASLQSLGELIQSVNVEPASQK